MLQPKRVKFRKQMRGRRKGLATGGHTIEQGDFGLIAMRNGWITARQIESSRVAINRHLRRGGKIWVRVFPYKSVSKKPAETRMGGGKAAVDYWVAVVKPGKVLFEVAGTEESLITEALRLASHKLPIPTKLIRRDRLAALT